MEPTQQSFSRNTFPHLFDAPPMGSAYEEAHRVAFGPPKETAPARDARYPAYAATMSDGRLVTDYRPQCTKNVRPGHQFYTKHWMIQHGEQLMEESRRRQVEWTGATLPMANTVPPPAGIVHSTPFQSELQLTNHPLGLGVERADARAPPLFGTFEYEPTLSELRANRKETQLTAFSEGGRNSRRGTYGVRAI
jgi:hypothetical protein